MKWAKGQSGNPSGRPKQVREVAELAKQHTEIAILTLVEIASKGENESARVMAANALLDRGYGKPMQPSEISINVLEHLSDASISALANAIDDLGDGSQDHSRGSATSH